MKTIAHISDLHFGTEDDAVTEALAAELAAGPSLVAISGDLTQRARPREFRQARAFLDALRSPYVVVPGNHDVPVYNLYERFAHPLRRYCREIAGDLSPLYADGELAVVGITTAHGLTLKSGRITQDMIDRACTQLSAHPAAWKIVVAHHPFLIPEGGDPDDLVDNAQEAIDAFRATGVDLLLGGHLHLPYSDDVAFRDRARRIVAVAAGTAISTRLRGHPNSYNHLAFDGDDVTVTNRVWDGSAFVDGDVKRYRREGMRFDKVAAFSVARSEVTAP
jgi:3',5'-cyclic AMP phosphodiesterase CpdA